MDVSVRRTGATTIHVKVGCQEGEIEENVATTLKNALAAALSTKWNDKNIWAYSGASCEWHGPYSNVSISENLSAICTPSPEHVFYGKIVYQNLNGPVTKLHKGSRPSKPVGM